MCHYGLYLIDKLLQESGHSLSEWKSMPQWKGNWNQRLLNPLIAEQLAYNAAQEAQRLVEHEDTAPADDMFPSAKG